MNFRFKRFSIIYLIPILVLAILYWTDPDHGASTTIWVIRLSTAVLATTMAHLTRKALFDYPEADMRMLFRKAGESSNGAGLALIALAIILAALLALFSGPVKAQDVRSYIPAKCAALVPLWKAEVKANWPGHPSPSYLPALGEHESCVSLTSSRCCSPTAQLKTAREEGAGITQITRAYSADGQLRFDALQELKARHPVLAEWSWANVYQRPDLQVRAAVLMAQDCYKQLGGLVMDPMRVIEFCDAAYNGGYGGMQNDRRACYLKAGCNPQVWFGNVELTCTKSRAALYGARSACDINRHHVDDVVRVREPKYQPLMVL